MSKEKEKSEVRALSSADDAETKNKTNKKQAILRAWPFSSGPDFGTYGLDGGRGECNRWELGGERE